MSFPGTLDTFPTLTQNSFMDDPANYADVYMNSITTSIVNIEQYLLTAAPGGITAVAAGGTGANLTATGGANQVVRQSMVGGSFSVSALVAADIPWSAATAITTTGPLIINQSGVTPPVVGAAAPSLHAVNASGNFTVQQLSAFGTAVSPVTRYAAARGTNTLPSAVQAGDSLGSMVAHGYGTNTWLATSDAALILAAAEAFSNSAHGTQLTLMLTPTGGSIVKSQVLSITTAVLSFIGQIASTVATGTAPFAVTSTTNVANLNASSLNGATFAAPGPIGATPSTGSFTTLATTGAITSGANSDITLQSGFCMMGLVPAGSSGRLYLAQSANYTTTNYALLQLSTGATFINAATGQTVSARINNATAFTIGASGFTFSDLTNTWNPITYNGGLVGAGSINLAGTLDATSTVSASLIMAGGAAIAKALQVGTSGTFGGAISTANGAISAVATAGNAILQATSAAASALVIANGFTGNSGRFRVQIAGTTVYDWSGTATTLSLLDSQAGSTPLVYTAGAIGACNLTMAGTLSATSAIAGAFVVGNGTAATSVAIGAGNINAGAQVTAPTVSCATLTASSVVQSTASFSAYSGNGAAQFLQTGAGGSFPFNTAHGMVLQNGNATATAGSGFYFGVGNGATAVALVGIIGGTNPAANTFGGSLLYGRNNAAADTAGVIGETISSVITSSVALAATGTPGNLTSIALTAGKWLVTFWGAVNGGATGLTASTNVFWSISATTAANGTQGSTMAQQTVPSLIANGCMGLGAINVVLNLSASATYFAVVQAAYSAGSPTMNGTLTAVRIG